MDTHSAEVIVEIQAGKVRGAIERGVHVFRGIPYADDPTGPNRFLPPRPLKPWAGVREATSYGPSAVQGRRVDPSRPADPLSEAALEMGENCLVLNVWTPQLTGRRPVMVWLHGGGFSVGSGSTPMYAGENLARRGDVVVITVNHRLGLLGFLQLEQRFGAEYAGSGNAGILDLVAALEWVRDNVERFGGDPGCVTVFGESGGGGKLSALLASRAARGLLHRAIIQSGPPFQFPDIATATEVTDKVFAKLGLGSNATPQALVEVAAEKLLKVQFALGAGGGPSPGGMSFAPVIDGRALFDWPERALAAGSYDDVPLLIGTNLDEARFMLMINPHLRKTPPELSAAELLERVSPGCDRNADALIARYRTFYPELSNFDLLLKIESEQFRLRSIRLAEHKLQATKAPVFMYLFNWTTARLARYGAFHGLEIPFIFDTLPTMPHMAVDPDAPALVRRMLATWVGFARTGRPACEEVPEWAPYDLAKRSTMCIDREWSLERDPHGEERAAWDDVPTGPTTRPWSRVVA